MDIKLDYEEVYFITYLQSVRDTLLPSIPYTWYIPAEEKYSLQLLFPPSQLYAAVLFFAEKLPSLLDNPAINMHSLLILKIQFTCIAWQAR